MLRNVKIYLTKINNCKGEIVLKIVKDFEEVYVTADLHLSNYVLNRSIKLRGFSDPKEHTIFIRNLINSTIKNRSANLYILGDLGMKQESEELAVFIKSLTPRVKVAIGNHDSKKQLTALWNAGVIQDCKHEYVFRWRGNIFHFHHLPLLEQEYFFEDSYQCHGHTHGSIQPYLRSMDVGLDATDMKILNLEEVVEARKSFHNVNKNRERLFSGLKMFPEVNPELIN